MRTVFTGIFILLLSMVHAQDNCASSSYFEAQRTLDPTLAIKQGKLERFILHQITSSTSHSNYRGNPTGIIRIPVVVHILYKDPSQNIPDAQIFSQIDALNRDFRRKNADTVNTPDRFKNRAADIQIEFALATADPNGNPTNGIVRKRTGITYFTGDDRIKFNSQGGDDAWDSRYYLNIWVGNLFGLLGYSSIAGGSADKDGIVINFSSFGTINTSSSHNMGRIAVHEVGHWLNLKHIWGDAPCGDDLVDDTPVQGTYTQGCPNGFKSSCNNGSLGDMFMNYMDLTDDACMNLFTQGQKQRMLAMFAKGGPRYEMLSSRGLDIPYASDATTTTKVTSVNRLLPTLTFYPNPARNVLTLNVTETWVGKYCRIVNMNGLVLKEVVITSVTQQIDVSTLRSGIYFIQGTSGVHEIKEKFIKL
jgi:Pregnancy-associated plasma protein-A/Secretion system C-terminal sorting domain